MAHATPQVVDNRLIRPDRPDEVITVGTVTWFEWLEQATTFAFVDANHRYTVRKERAGRTGWYWKVYRMEEGKLRRAYLGKSSELTIERLHTAADSLAKQEPPRGYPTENREPTRDSNSPSSQLLTAKLTPPSARAGLIPRPRLVEQLILGIRGKLTLLLAPAGYGKTTLLADWLQRIQNEELRIDKDRGAISDSQFSILNAQFRVAWLSLDAEDNNPVRFWSYLIAALAAALGSEGAPFSQSALGALQASQPPRITAVLTELLNALSVLTTDIILILDDYHEIEEPAIHQALSYLIERLPPQLHLVLATRTEPPLPLARLRVRGELVELRVDDLRFTVEETSAFLTQIQGLQLPAADLVALDKQTEGWPAAIQLVALTLRSRSNLTSSIMAFKASQRLLKEYVASEMLDRLPQQLQHFVLQTAILDRICGSLCDFVTEIENEKLRIEKRPVELQHFQFSILNSQFILEQLAHVHQLVTPLDDEHTWYRYHPLVVAAARERLSAEISASGLATRHQRASNWYEAQGLIVEAIEHALAGSDVERAARLIECHGLSLARGSSASLVRRWLDVLPTSLVRARPALCLYHGLGLLATRDQEAAEACLQDAEDGITTAAADDQALDTLAQIALARASIARYTGDLVRCLALSQHVLLLAPKLSITVQAEATLNLARAYQLSGDAGSAAEQLAEQAIALLRRSGEMSGVRMGIANLAFLYALQGRLRVALATYAQATQLASQDTSTRPMHDHPALHTGLADDHDRNHASHSATRFSADQQPIQQFEYG